MLAAPAQEPNEWLTESVGLGDRVDAHAGVIIEPALSCLGGREEVDMVTEGRSHAGLVDHGHDGNDSCGRVDAGDPCGFDGDPNVGMVVPVPWQGDSIRAVRPSSPGNTRVSRAYQV